MSKAFLASTALLLAIGIGSAQAANTSPSQNQSASTSTANQPGAEPSGSMNMRQQLQDTLAKQGYSDINVVPSSFLVHAKDKKGEPVAMVIGPDSITAVTEIAPNKQANATNDPTKTKTNTGTQQQ